MRSAAFAMFLAAATLFAFGCAKSNPNRSSAANGGDYYAVKIAAAPFFHYGPQQANGPDRKLPRDTLMTLDRSSLGYAKVKLTTGEDGYVSRDDIAPAPAALVAAAFPTPTPAPRIYPEPTLPSLDATPAVEPTAIPAPSVSPN